MSNVIDVGRHVSRIWGRVNYCKRIMKPFLERSSEESGEGILRSLRYLISGVPEASCGFAVELFYKVLMYSPSIFSFCFRLLGFCHLCQIGSNTHSFFYCPGLEFEAENYENWSTNSFLCISLKIWILS